MKKWMFNLSMLCLSLLHPAFAVKINTLYQAELPVATQTSEERNLAVKQGLAQVFIKLSGNPTIESNRTIKSALRRAEYYVEEFRYYNSPSSERTREGAEEADNGLASSQYFIHIRYNKADINHLLQRAGIPIWGEQRPLILVWLAADMPNQETEIIGNETPGVLLDVMKNAGIKYGLPLIFPVMDVNDISQVTVNDVAERDLMVIRAASKRYQPDAFLIGKIAQANNTFKSEWELVVKDHHWTWMVTDKSSDAVIKTVLNEVSQVLVQNGSHSA